MPEEVGVAFCLVENLATLGPAVFAGVSAQYCIGCLALLHLELLVCRHWWAFSQILPYALSTRTRAVPICRSSQAIRCSGRKRVAP